MTPDPLPLAIRSILISDWDPSNVAAHPEAHATYDTYVHQLVPLIRQGASPDAIADFLFDRERESMCFPPLGKQRLQTVARKLAALKP